MGEAQRDEIAKLEALYAANPEGRVFTHLAEAYRKAGNLERAREILEEGLSRHPDSGTAFVVLGRVAFDGERPDDAREAFGRALTLDEGNLVAHRYLAELALARGDRESARRHFEELLARNPTDESLLGRLRELSAPTHEDPSPAADAPALAQADEYGWASGGDGEGTLDGGALHGDPGEPAGGVEEAEDSWTLPSEGFGGEAEAGDPLPTLDLEPADGEPFADQGSSADSWSWDEPSAGPADFVVLDDFGTVEGLEGSGWDEPGLESELPLLEGLEPLPEFDAVPPEEADLAEPAMWLADAPEAQQVEEIGLPWLGVEAESLEPAPTDDAALGEPSADDGVQPPWRPYAMGEDAVADALADAGAVESSSTWPEPDAAPAGGLLPGRPDDVMTETIADLYLTQGFPGRAADVYRSLLLRHPDDARLQERLAEAERKAATETAPAGKVVAEWTGDESTGEESTGKESAGKESAGGEELAGGERVEAPAAAAGPPIAAYFRSLLDWRASAPPDAAAADEPAPGAADAGEADREGYGASGGWEAGDTWAFVEAETEVEAAAASDPAPVFAEGASAAVSGDPTPEAELMPEAEAEAEVLPELVLDDPASEAESFGGWSPDMLLDPAPAAPERMPWEVPEPASLAAPEPEAAGADVAAPTGEGAGGSEGEHGAAQPVAQESATEDEEDEDLEMFRSWLQSLKK